MLNNKFKITFALTMGPILVLCGPAGRRTDLSVGLNIAVSL